MRLSSAFSVVGPALIFLPLYVFPGHSHSLHLIQLVYDLNDRHLKNVDLLEDLTVESFQCFVT